MKPQTNSEQLKAWNGYEGRHWAENSVRYDRANSGANGPLLEAASIQPEYAVLDIGCGSGALSRIAASKAHRGRVVGIDISRPMLDRARDLARRDQLTNVDYILADAQLYDFPEKSFDLAMSRFGVMFFSDPVQAFRNIHTALTPGGSLAMVTLRNLGPTSELLTPFLALARYCEVDDEDEETAAGGPGSLSDPDIIESVLGKAGFDSIRIAPILVPMNFGMDAHDAASFIIDWGPSRHLLETAGRSRSDAAIERISESLKPFERLEGVVLRSDVWLTTARRAFE